MAGGDSPAEGLFRSGRRRPRYPWQLELPPWAPKAKMTEAERRADFARSSFGFWKGLLEDGTGRHPLLFYDECRGFFRFSDGTFALSPEHGNWPALKERGFFRQWGMVSDGGGTRP